ncbi:MAG: type II toxin-antitoxin system VapC family toxin [Bryobacteraceae bacterium]
MITAIDTNILLDILVPNEEFYEASANALQAAAGDGSLAISDIVYAELCIHFEAQRDCDTFLASNQIRVQELTREALFLASRAWRIYRQQGGKRTRILADFLVGAHAQKQAQRLLSRDRGFYRKLFPSLDVDDPTETGRAFRGA